MNQSLDNKSMPAGFNGSTCALNFSGTALRLAVLIRGRRFDRNLKFSTLWGCRFVTWTGPVWTLVRNGTRFYVAVVIRWMAGEVYKVRLVDRSKRMSRGVPAGGNGCWGISPMSYHRWSTLHWKLVLRFFFLIKRRRVLWWFRTRAVSMEHEEQVHFDGT